MSNNSSPRVPPNHPFLIQTPPALCGNFQARASSSSHLTRPTSQLTRTPRFEGPPQFGRAPRPQCPIFGSTDIRERKKPPIATPVPSQLPSVCTPPRRNSPHQPSSLGPAYIKPETLFCSSPPLSSQSPKFLPLQASDIPVTPGSKSSFQPPEVVKPDTVEHPPQEAAIAEHPPHEAGAYSSSQCATAPIFQSASPPSVPSFQQPHSSWSDAESRMKKKEEEEQIVSEALAFLQEHKRKKAAQQKSAHGESTETKNTTEDANWAGQMTPLLLRARNFEGLQSIESDPACSEENDWKGKASNPPSFLPNCNGTSATSGRDLLSEDKKSSVMDASIQELSTLLLDCQYGLTKGVQGAVDAQDCVLVDLTESADVTDRVGLLNPPLQSEIIPKFFPYSMPLDVEVLHLVKEEEMPREKNVTEAPILQSESIPTQPPQWFSNTTCSDLSDEEEMLACVAPQNTELYYVKEKETQEMTELQQKEKADAAENGPHAPFFAQDELLVQGFILSESHSLAAELWMVETLQELLSPTLASLICGFLNTAGGGTIYAGVRQNGEVRGLQLSNADRVHLGQRVQTLANSLLLPRPPPTCIALDLLPVQTELNQSGMYVLRLLVRPMGKQGEQFKVHNLGGGDGEGIFFRRGPKPQFNRRQEME